MKELYSKVLPHYVYMFYGDIPIDNAFYTVQTVIAFKLSS